MDLNAAADTEHSTAENDRCVRACAEHEAAKSVEAVKAVAEENSDYLVRFATHAGHLSLGTLSGLSCPNWTAHNYIPPAPDAVKLLIRDLTSACRDKHRLANSILARENCCHERLRGWTDK